MTVSPALYRGRFAPSPTGPLHLGSLIAALASYLDARHCGGRWLLRMDDLDPPREVDGAAESILHSLRCHGLYWDESLMWQSQRQHAYQQALAQLTDQQHSFSCTCNRRELGPGGSCKGSCRQRQSQLTPPLAIRVKVPGDYRAVFNDQLQGPQDCPLGQQLSDFVIHRKDQLTAYQLAVVVDDAEMGITHIMRGSDLLDSCPRQIYLQTLLGCATPQYSHIPVITHPDGQKLSKQNHAPALSDQHCEANLRAALAFLRQALPPTNCRGPEQILAFACQHWSVAALPQCMAVATANANSAD